MRLPTVGVGKSSSPSSSGANHTFPLLMGKERSFLTASTVNLASPIHLQDGICACMTSLTCDVINMWHKAPRDNKRTSILI